jgi:hypothetical protein
MGPAVREFALRHWLLLEVGLAAVLAGILIAGGLILKASVRMSQELRRGQHSRRNPRR